MEYFKGNNYKNTLSTPLLLDMVCLDISFENHASLAVLITDHCTYPF
jgi:hypothetical protein